MFIMELYVDVLGTRYKSRLLLRQLLCSAGVVTETEYLRNSSHRVIIAKIRKRGYRLTLVG